MPRTRTYRLDCLRFMGERSSVPAVMTQNTIHTSKLRELAQRMQQSMRALQETNAHDPSYVLGLRCATNSYAVELLELIIDAELGETLPGFVGADVDEMLECALCEQEQDLEPGSFTPHEHEDSRSQECPTCGGEKDVDEDECRGCSYVPAELENQV